MLLPYLDPIFAAVWNEVNCPDPGAFPMPIAPGCTPKLHAHRSAPDQWRLYWFDYALMKEKLLDRYEVEYAILTGEEGVELSTLANPYYAAALAKAHNDWIIAEWLPLDKRFKGSIIVSPQDPRCCQRDPPSVNTPTCASAGFQRFAASLW